MKWKPFLLSHLAIALLIGTFLWPVSRSLWELVDVAVFKFLNGSLIDHPIAQHFWAFVNHKRADLVEDAIFLLFLVLAIVKAPRKLHRAAQLVFTIVVVASVVFFVNRTLLRNHTIFPRESPSLVVTPCVRVSHEIPWMTIKDETVASFPGDHATTLLLFALFYQFYVGGPLARWATIYAIFRLMPRLVLGAHWFSDIGVGTLSLVLFVFAWIVLTPVESWAVDKIERVVKLFARKEPREKQL